MIGSASGYKRNTNTTLPARSTERELTQTKLLFLFGGSVVKLVYLPLTTISRYLCRNFQLK